MVERARLEVRVTQEQLAWKVQESPPARTGRGYHRTAKLETMKHKWRSKGGRRRVMYFAALAEFKAAFVEVMLDVGGTMRPAKPLLPRLLSSVDHCCEPTTGGKAQPTRSLLASSRPLFRISFSFFSVFSGLHLVGILY
jgi:hypothetical protein